MIPIVPPVDYIDIIPAKPLYQVQERMIEELRKIAMDTNVTFVMPKPGGPAVDDLYTWVAIGVGEGRSNVVHFEMLKAVSTGKTVLYFDYEASFDPENWHRTINT